MHHRPLVQAACFWIAGSAAACMFQGSEFWLAWAGMTLILPIYGVIRSMSWRGLLALWVIFTLAAGYWIYIDSTNTSRLSAAFERSYQAELPDKTEAVIEGTIVSPVEIDGDRVDFTISLTGVAAVKPMIDAKTAPLHGDSQMTLSDTAGEKLVVNITLSHQEELAAASGWARGQRVRIQGSLERPATSSNFGGFDYRSYLHYQRVHWLFKVKGASGVEELEATKMLGTPQLLARIERLRESLGSRVDKLFPEWQGGYMKGLLIGLSDELDPEKYVQFTNLGLSHILAISGSHVAINIGLLLGLCRLCRLTRESSQLLALCSTPLYVLLTGFTPSVIRAGIMTMLGLYLLRRGLLKDGLHLVAASCLAMLIWEPYLLVNVSFQLSFAVTAGLIVFVPLLMPWLRWLPARIRSAVAITLAAQLVSFPLTIYYFNQVSLLSLLANLILVPLVSLIALPGGTAALLASLIWMPLARWIAYPVALLNRLTFALTEWLNAYSSLMTYWKSPSLLWILAFYAMLYWLLSREAGRAKELDRLRRSVSNQDDTISLPPFPGQTSTSLENHSLISSRELRRTWRDIGISLTAAAAIAGLLYWGYQPVYPKGSGFVEFLDVGQGDSALITTPSGLHILVDGGGTVSFRKPNESWRVRRDPYEVGAKTLVPLLKQRGIHRLDAVVLTHGDQDHIGGLHAVLSSYSVGAILMNGSLADSDSMDRLMMTAIEQDIPIYAVKTGQVLQPDQLTKLVFLAPEDEVFSSGLPYTGDQNTRSVVFRLTMDGASFLFTGDMDAQAERQVLETISNRASEMPLQSDIMKVAHHGSKTSTSQEWLTRVKPKVSVISVGRSNLYGHPNKGVVDRLEAAGSRIYRTDQNGAIQFRVQGGKLFIRSKKSMWNEAD